MSETELRQVRISASAATRLAGIAGRAKVTQRHVVDWLVHRYGDEAERNLIAKPKKQTDNHKEMTR